MQELLKLVKEMSKTSRKLYLDLRYDDEKTNEAMANFHMGEETAYNIVAMLIEEKEYAKKMITLYKAELEGSETK